MFAPLREGDRTVAYFEGVYRIEPEALGAMDRGLLESVVLVVLVILAAAAALYPVILRLNGDLLRLSGDLAHANMGMLVRTLDRLLGKYFAEEGGYARGRPRRPEGPGSREESELDYLSGAWSLEPRPAPERVAKPRPEAGDRRAAW